jgi:hypothetical protein
MLEKKMYLNEVIRKFFFFQSSIGLVACYGHGFSVHLFIKHPNDLPTAGLQFKIAFGNF